MKKQKTTKKALFSSVLSLLLCLTMLIGTTFAWFTDSVSSGKNTILAGNLDVELYFQTEGQADWTKVDGDTNVFMENALWEPGHTEVVKLKVVNEGSLALKYRFGINIFEETGSINVDNEAFKLSDFIKYGVVPGAQSYTRDEAIAAVDAEATKISDGYTKANNLLPGTEESESADCITMVVYMPTTVGNEANHAKDKPAPQITLGLSLYATQMVNENDSFGSDYDAMDDWDGTVPTEMPSSFVADSESHTIYINDAQALFYLNTLYSGDADSKVFPQSQYWGYDIVLMSDIDLGNQPFTPIKLGKLWMNANYYEKCNGDAKFETWGDRQRGLGNITAYGEYSRFDGNGHTIKNIALTSATEKNLGLFSNVNNVSNLKLENVTLTSTDTTADAGVAIGALSAWHANGVRDKNAAPAVISNVSVTNVTITGGKYSGGLIGYSGHDIIGCEVTNVVINNGWNSAGALVGFADAKNCTVKDCTVFKADLNCARTDRIGALIGRTNLVNTQMTIADNSTLLIKGTSVLVGNNAANIPVDKNNRLVLANAEITEITTVEDMLLFGGSVNLGGVSYAGKTVKLNSALDFTGVDFEPIGTTKNSFKGTFDGQNNAISNLNISGTNYVGLFGVVEDATVKDLTVKNADVNGTSCVGVLVGGKDNAKVIVNNVTVTGNIRVVGNYKVGGVIGNGYVIADTVSVLAKPGSFVEGKYAGVDLEGDSVGGITGYSGHAYKDYNNILVKGLTIMGSRKVGGVIGCLNDSHTKISNATVEGCTVGINASADYISSNAGKIFVGGVVGEWLNNIGVEIVSPTVKDVTVIAPEGSNAGAVIGGSRSGGTLEVTGAVEENVSIIK